jgi:hypothetical protein
MRGTSAHSGAQMTHTVLLFEPQVFLCFFSGIGKGRRSSHITSDSTFALLPQAFSPQIFVQREKKRGGRDFVRAPKR